jgi:hypothetical protein
LAVSGAGKLPLPESGKPSCRVIEFDRGEEDCGNVRNEDRAGKLIVSCHRLGEWPHLYCGIFDFGVGSLGRIPLFS